MPNINHKTIMRTEVKADIYSGDSCDEVKNYFNTYCDGDKDSEDHSDDIVIKLDELPAGAIVMVQYPCCPKCGIPRGDKMKFDNGAYKIIGHAEKCDCDFNWDNWVQCEYS